MLPLTAPLTDRQQREQDYHRDFAAKHDARADQLVETDVIADTARRPWNALWSMYDRILAAGLGDRRVLVPGCGFGEDALRLARLGAQVSAFDISPEIIGIAERRARNFSPSAVAFGVMTAERMDYPDDSFDAVVFVDILHHVDIAATMAEIRRVLKPGGLVIGDELYTHSALQRVRDSTLVAGGLYPLMRKWIYRTDTPYITADEHKIDQHEFRIVQDSMARCEADYFGVLEGRLFPYHIGWASRLDRAAMRVAGPIAPLLGSRVVFQGENRKVVAAPR